MNGLLVDRQTDRQSCALGTGKTGLLWKMLCRVVTFPILEAGTAEIPYFAVSNSDRIYCQLKTLFFFLFLLFLHHLTLITPSLLHPPLLHLTHSQPKHNLQSMYKYNDQYPRWATPYCSTHLIVWCPCMDRSSHHLAFGHHQPPPK